MQSILVTADMTHKYSLLVKSEPLQLATCGMFLEYTALPWQNRLTDSLDKIEFLPPIGSGCQYLPMKNIKHVSL